jgi:hypothetical protein
MRCFYLLFVIFNCSLFSFSQEPNVIKVKRESNLVKAEFDNTELMLMAIDRFGNVTDNKISSYKLSIKTKKEVKQFEGFGNSLSPQAISYLNKLTRTAKLFFNEIVAEDGSHLQKLPDLIEQWFPDCKNCSNEQNKH